MMNKYERIESLTKGNKILDVGCAQKPNSKLKGYVVGLDIQKKIVLPHNYSKFVNVNLNKSSIPFRKDYFDTVILGDVIEHIENPSFVLRESNRVLKSGGKLVLSTPHANDWWTTVHNWFLPIKDSDKGEHLSNWSKNDMIRLLKLNGFKVVKIYGTHLRVPLFPCLRVPVCCFYMLSWVLIYDCVKVRLPFGGVFTKNVFGNNIKIKT